MPRALYIKPHSVLSPKLLIPKLSGLLFGSQNQTMEVDMGSCFILFFIILFSTFLPQTFFSKSSKSRPRLPPSPMALPIIGHFHHLGPSAHRSFYKLSKRFGPLVYLRLGSVPHLLVSSPDMAREALRTQEHLFSNRVKTKTSHYLTYGSQNFGNAPYGPYWRFMKKLCMSELLGSRAVEQFRPLRCDEVLRLVQMLRQKSEVCEAVDMSRELRSLANNVISRMAMSRKYSGSEREAEEARKVVEDLLELVGKFDLGDYIGFFKCGVNKRVEEVRRRFDAMLEGILKEKEETRRGRKMEKMGGGDEEGCVKDLLDILLDISEDESAEMRLTRENIKGFIQDMFIAGTDTSALTTEWALAELINHPEVLKKAREEIDAVLGKTRLVEESDIPNLPYLQAITKETLRLHPAVALIGRQSTESCKISGYDIPANTRLFVNVWAIGKDPAYWDDPLEFRPERFMEDDGRGTSFRGQHFQFLPFGSGRRTCPGITLALQVMPYILAALIQCFEWKVEEGVVDMTEGISLTVIRKYPLVCTPVARLDFSMLSLDS